MNDDLRACIAADCDRAGRTRGMCDKHYARWRHHGHTGLLPRPNNATKVCKGADCNRTVVARGMCDKHYRRWKHHGNTDLPPKVKKVKPPCAVEGCDGVPVAQGYCNLHYGRLRRTGTTAPASGPSKEDYEKRFWARVEKGSDCWEWKAGINQFGYGYYFDGTKKLAHRFSYEASVGPIPDGLTIDHLCFNRACVNPAHLEPVTHAENSRRMWVKRKEEVK